MPQGDLTAIADEQLDPHGRQNGIANDVGHRDEIKSGKLGDEDKKR